MLGPAASGPQRGPVAAGAPPSDPNWSSRDARIFGGVRAFHECEEAQERADLAESNLNQMRARAVAKF